MWRARFKKIIRLTIDISCLLFAVLLIFLVNVFQQNIFRIPDSPEYTTEIMRGMTTLVAISIASTTFLIGFSKERVSALKIPFRISSYLFGIFFSIGFSLLAYRFLIDGKVVSALNHIFLSATISWIMFFNLFYFLYIEHG